MDSGAFAPPGSMVPPPPILGSWDNPVRNRRRRGGGKQALCGAAAQPPSGGAPVQPRRLLDAGARVAAGQQAELQKEQRIKRMLLEFKTAPCASARRPQATHDHRCCRFFHSDRDRRRPVFVLDGEGAAVDYCYAAQPCNESFDNPQTVCSRGDECMLCHSTAELLYHPEFFRKRLCHQAPRCPRGQLCAFAHSRQELIAPHFTQEEEVDPSEDFITWNFKTKWCPIGGPHDWEICVYAHTYRDWRRTPAIGYTSWPCPNWAQSIASGPTELEYEHRCPNGMACSLAHGAKEQLYHPHFYKTTPCSEGACNRRTLCAFTHGGCDTRGAAPSPISSEEAVAKAMQGPMPWAEATLTQYQPSFCKPPRYHALEEQTNTRRSGKGGKRDVGPRQALLGKSWGQGISKQPLAQQARDRHAGPPGQHFEGAARQPYYFQMAAAQPSYQDLYQEPAAHEPKPCGLSPQQVVWTQQASLDSNIQSFPTTFLTMPSGEACAPFPPQGFWDEETSPLSAAAAATVSYGSPMAVPLQHNSLGSSSPLGIIPASVWAGLAEKGSRGRCARKGAAIRTPSSFGSLGSPRESITPTETPGTPRIGEEVATSAQTSSSGRTSDNKTRTVSAERALQTSIGSRLRTRSAEPVLATPKGQESRPPHDAIAAKF